MAVATSVESQTIKEQDIVVPETEFGSRKICELDQIGETINPLEYVVLQREMLSRLWNPADKQTKKGLSRDRLDGEVFISAPGGLETGMVGVVAYLGSDIEGLHGTGNTMMFRPKNISEWVDLSREKRQEKFAKEVLPNIEHAMFVRHGWGGRRSGQEEHARGLAYSKKKMRNGQSVGEHTLYVLETVMGGEYTLDSANRAKFDTDSIQAQVVEVQDHLSVYMSREKAKGILNDESGLVEKREILQAIKSAIVQGGSISESDPLISKVQRLFDLENLEAEVESLNWLQEKTDAEIGHSMHGWVSIRMFFDIWINAISDIPSKYIDALQPDLLKAKSLIARQLDLRRTKFIDSLEDPGLQNIYARLRGNLRSQPRILDVRPKEEMMKGRLRNALILGLDPVIEGNEVAEIDQQFVALQKSVGGSAIRALDSLANTGNPMMDKVHQKAVELSRSTKVMDTVMNHFIGQDALGFPVIKAGHEVSVVDEDEYHLQCQVNLANMAYVAGHDTRGGVRANVSALENFLIAMSEKDRTVLIKGTKQFAEAVQLTLKDVGQVIPDFEMTLPDSNHYPNPAEWGMVAERVWGHVWKTREKLAEESRKNAIAFVTDLGIRVLPRALHVGYMASTGMPSVSEEDLERVFSDSEEVLKLAASRNRGK